MKKRFLARSWHPSPTWPLTKQAAKAYGQIAYDMRRTGRPIGKMDMLIAAIALSLGMTTVVSADGDLTAVSGLTVANWSAAKGGLR